MVQTTVWGYVAKLRCGGAASTGIGLGSYTTPLSQCGNLGIAATVSLGFIWFQTSTTQLELVAVLYIKLLTAALFSSATSICNPYLLCISSNMLYHTALLSILMGLALAQSNGTSGRPSNKRPNFIIIMTDDQDLHLNSLEYQPAVKKYFARQGTFFNKHYVTMAQCCPSRVSFLTGMAGHNTNVTDVLPPFGMSNYASLTFC